jgi:signal peptidase
VNLKNTANIVAGLVLIAIVAPFVIYSVPAVVGAEYSFVVLTASMTPAIAPGDVVIVDDRDTATIAEGDVITFTRGTNEVPVTHRVTAVTTSGGELAFETKGDANSDPDASVVVASNVLGTVIFSIPFIGYVIQFTNTPYGFLALVVVPIGLLIVSELWTLYRGRSPATTAESTAAAGELATAAVAEPASAATDEPATAVAPEGTVTAAEKSTEDMSGFVITSRTLEGAFGPLLVLAIYSGYVAYIGATQTGLTAVAIAMVVGSGISLLAVSMLLVWPRLRPEVSLPESVTVESESDPELSDADLELSDTAPEQPTADGGVDQVADTPPAAADGRGDE